MRATYVALHSSPKSRDPVKIFVQFALAVQELHARRQSFRDADGGLGANLFECFLGNMLGIFLYRFARQKMVFLCYIMQFYSCFKVFDAVLKMSKKFLFYGTIYKTGPSERRFDEIFT